MKRNWVLSGLLCVLLCSGICMGTLADDLLLRAEVSASDGTEIQISVPLCLLELLKTSIPAPVPISKEELSPLIDALMSDLASMKGSDLVRVEDEDEVHIWIDDVKSNKPEEANFIKVDVHPGDDDEPVVHVCIPKGLIILASHIGNKVLEAHSQELFSQFGKLPPIPAPPALHIEKQKEKVDAQKEKAKKAVKEAEKLKKDAENSAEKIKSEVLEKVIKELLKNLDID